MLQLIHPELVAERDEHKPEKTKDDVPNEPDSLLKTQQKDREDGGSQQ